MNSIGLCIYTHTDCEDIWNPCFERLKKYGDKFVKKYVFLNAKSISIPSDYEQIIYEDSKLFSEKFSSCLEKVEEDYIIYLHEDFILYDYVNFDKILQYKELLENNDDNICQIQLIRSGMPAINKPGFKFIELERYRNFDLYVLPENCKQYNGQTTMWKRKILLKVLENNKYGNSSQKLKDEKIIDLENPVTHKWLVENNIRGLFHYKKNSKQRGLSWDSAVFPYISTAVRKGKWDLRQGKEKLILNVIKEFNIDINKRSYFK